MSAMVMAFPAYGQAEEGAFRRCRGMTDAVSRLACYDALPLPAPGARAAPPVSGAPAREASLL